MKLSRFVIFSALALLALGAQSADIYVATTGNDTTGDGSAAAPYKTIPHALTQLGAANDGTIHIGAGTFIVNTALSTTGAIKFIGEGADATFITREGTSYKNKKLFILQNTGALVADLAITNVYAQDVGGTSGCIVELPNTTGAGLVSNVVFKGCTAGSAGAGYVVYIGQNASAEVVGCTFDQNTLRDSGGSGCIYVNGATKALVENCAFFGNKGFSTGAVRVKNKATVRNCTFVDNETNFTNPGSARGGGVYVEAVSSGNTRFDHCVFFGNRAPYDTSSPAPDVYYSGSINAMFTNCFSHCAWDAEGKAFGPGAICVDRSDFTDWRGGDYRPHTASRLLQATDELLIGALAPSSATGPAFTPSGPAEITLHPGDSIQEALAAAPAGQIINLAEGVFVVTGRLDVLQDVEIRGAGAGRTFLTRTDAGLKNTRFLAIGHPRAVVSGVCISNVMAQANNQPGALFIWARGGRLENSRIYGCNGGGSGSGGTIGIAGGTNSIITHCVIDANKTYGAGNESIVYLYGGVLDNCLVVKNTSFTHGCVSIRGDTRVWNCTIADNTCLSKQASQVCGGIMWNYTSFNTASKARVVNTLVARNTAAMDSSSGAPEWYRNGGTMAAFTNCFTSCAWGSGVPVVGSGSVSFNNGIGFAAANDYHVDTGSDAFEHGAVYDGMAETDLVGAGRNQGNAPDIGCYETAVADAECSFSVSGSVFTNETVTLHPTILGGAGRTLTCEWTIHNDSASEPDAVYTTTGDADLAVAFATAGWRSVALRVFADGAPFAESARAAVLHVAVREVYLAPYDAAIASAYPYGTPGTAACTNLAALVSDSLPGQTIHLLPGCIDIGGQTDISGLAVVGEGWNTSILTNAPMRDGQPWPAGYADYLGLIRLNAADTLLEGLCLSNVITRFNGASVVCIAPDGGTMRNVKVVGCRGGSSSNGYIAGANGRSAVIDRCWFAGNTVQANGSCGCILAESGALVSSTLVDDTRDLYVGGGIIASGTGTTIRNCTVTRNRLFQNSSWAPTSQATGLDYRSDGNIYPVISNCVFALNAIPAITGDGGSAWRGSTAALAAHAWNCAFGGGAAVGEGAVAVNDADTTLFVNPAAGDFTPRRVSPLHNAGLYDASWMDDATDLAGNPRVDHYKRGVGLVDIGALETPFVPDATVILLK